jgi:hypothetical protein
VGGARRAGSGWLPADAGTSLGRDEVIAWPEPQLGEDAIEALARDERERLHARRKWAEDLVEQLVRSRGLGNLGEHFIEHFR